MIVLIDTIDLGSIPVAQAKTFTYTLTAEDYPITFTKIAAGCGSCTVANLAKKAIDAEESITMTVTFTPKTMGVQTKTITLTYSENDNVLTKVFTFIATVV